MTHTLLVIATSLAPDSIKHFRYVIILQWDFFYCSMLEVQRKSIWAAPWQSNNIFPRPVDCCPLGRNQYSGRLLGSSNLNFGPNKAQPEKSLCVCCSVTLMPKLRTMSEDTPSHYYLMLIKCCLKWGWQDKLFTLIINSIKQGDEQEHSNDEEVEGGQDENMNPVCRNIYML